MNLTTGRKEEMAEKKFLDEQLLITHGTYTAQEIINIKEVKQRFLAQGESSLTLDERIRLANYAYLTETSFHEELRSRSFHIKNEGIIRKLSDEIVEGIDGESNELRTKMGYHYAPCASPSPSDISAGFELSPEHKYIDVGCGHGTVAIDVFKQVGCETYMLDPNVRNIRWAYKKLLEAGLAGNPKIKVAVSTVQDANLPLAYFDRAFLGRTIALENYKTTKEIQEACVRVIKDKGIIAIVHMPNGRVIPSQEMTADARLEESYCYNQQGYKFQLIKVQR